MTGVTGRELASWSAGGWRLAWLAKPEGPEFALILDFWILDRHLDRDWDRDLEPIALMMRRIVMVAALETWKEDVAKEREGKGRTVHWLCTDLPRSRRSEKL